MSKKFSKKELYFRMLDAFDALGKSSSEDDYNERLKVYRSRYDEYMNYTIQAPDKKKI